MAHRKIVVKTVRLDQELVDAVTAAVSTEERQYHRLNFSEIVKNGLLLVLATYGETHTPPHWRETRSINSSARINQPVKLSTAQAYLLEHHERLGTQD